MSKDKPQALDEDLADAFAELPLTHTESSHPAFDHQALSGIFGESPPTSTDPQRPHPNFDRRTFAEILSQPPPILADTKPAHPAFDQESFAEILSQSSTDSANAKALSPSFDHPALAEILSESQPVPINPQLSPFSFDTQPSSAPLSGQFSNEGPAEETVVVAPTTDAEDAQPQRPKSLLAKLHDIFSTRATPPPSDVEKDHSSPSAQLHRQQPVTDEDARQQQAKSRPTELPSAGLDQDPSSPRLTGQPGYYRPAEGDAAADFPTGTASAQTQQARSSLVDLVPPTSTNKEPPPSIFEKERSRPVRLDRLDSAESAERTYQPDNLEPTASTAPTDTQSAAGQQEWPPLTEPHLISINREASSPARETETPRPPLRSQEDELEPAAGMVAVAAAAETGNTRPQRATSLLAAEAPAPNSDIKSSPANVLAQPSRQSDNVEPAAGTGAAGPTKPPLQMFEKEPPRLDPASRTASVAPPPDAESAVTRAQPTKSPLAELDLNTAIRLRWVMRDIRSERTKLSPPSENDLAALMELGLVEMREGLPRLTALGVLALG